MAVAPFQKFYCFVEDICEKKHDLSADALKVMLTVNLPSAANTVRTDVTDLTTAGGYTNGGLTVPASPSPHVVPAPWNDPSGVDPEEAFVASLSSCHMLFFVDFARRGGFVVDSYVDEAEGILDKRDDGKMAMTRVTLRPKVTFSGASPPTTDEIADLHHRAHEACFIANSVTTEVTIEQ